jgi:hypothetical protein
MPKTVLGLVPQGERIDSVQAVRVAVFVVLTEVTIEFARSGWEGGMAWDEDPGYQ